MKCTNCGKEVSDTALVCGYCGHRLEAEETPAPPTQKPAVPAEKRESRAPRRVLWIVGGAVVILLLVLWRVGVFGFLESTTSPSGTDSESAVSATQEPYQEALPISIEPIDYDYEAPSLQELAGGADEPGTYMVEISPDTEARIILGWCATTQEILDQNFEHILWSLQVDGINIPLSEWGYYEGELGEGICIVYSGLVSAWPIGEYEIISAITIDEEINDGWDSYPPGDMTWSFIVNVTPETNGYPSQIDEVLANPELIAQENFYIMPLDTEYGNAWVEDGNLILWSQVETGEYDAYFHLNDTLGPGTAILWQISHDAGFFLTLQSGQSSDWLVVGTDEWAPYYIEGGDQVIEDPYVGEDQNLPPDDLYVLLAIGEDSEFSFLIWSQEDPSQKWEIRWLFDESWAGREWTASAFINDGETFLVDSFSIFSFSGFK